MTKRTWNPKKKKRVRKHGFLKRMRSLSAEMSSNADALRVASNSQFAKSPKAEPLYAA